MTVMFMDPPYLRCCYPLLEEDLDPVEMPEAFVLDCGDDDYDDDDYDDDFDDEDDFDDDDDDDYDDYDDEDEWEEEEDTARVGELVA